MFKAKEKSKGNSASWVSAAVGVISLGFTIIAGIMHLDGRILKLEEQNGQIHDGLAKIDRTIEGTMYSRKEAELNQRITDAKIQLIEQRIELVKSP